MISLFDATVITDFDFDVALTRAYNYIDNQLIDNAWYEYNQLVDATNTLGRIDCLLFDFVNTFIIQLHDDLLQVTPLSL